MKLPGVISLRNDLPTCAMPNGGFLRANCSDVLEVDEDALGGLGAQVDGRALVLHRAHVGLEHQVELARLGELAVRVAAARGAAAAHSGSAPPSLRLAQVVLAPAPLQSPRHWTSGSVKPSRWPDASQVLGCMEDRRVEGDDVVALLDHRAPPLAFTLFFSRTP